MRFLEFFFEGGEGVVLSLWSRSSRSARMVVVAQPLLSNACASPLALAHIIVPSSPALDAHCCRRWRRLVWGKHRLSWRGLRIALCCSGRRARSILRRTLNDHGDGG